MLLDFLKQAVQNNRVQGFMKTIRQCEGTDAPDGYNYLFGSNPGNDIRFTDFSDHPRIHRPFGKTTSSAAGAYQIMQPTWDDDIQKHLHLPDFSPANQDLGCAYLISEKDCLQKLMDGDFHTAIDRCNKVWASLPGSPYGQPTHSLEQVKEWYIDNGGTIA